MTSPYRAAGVLALLLGAGGPALADGPVRANEPAIGFVYPAGGRAGTSFRVDVGGQGLRRADEVHVSGGGVSGRVRHVLPPFQPLDREPRLALVRRLAELREARVAGRAPPPSTAELPSHPLLVGLESKSVEELDEVAAWFLRGRGPQPPKRAIAETAVVDLTIEPGAAPGVRELRLASPGGLTNPLRFDVGERPEVVEVERGPDARVHEAPVVLNGRVLAKDRDEHRFRAHRGRPLRIRADARALIPYQADAVPGWLQAALAVRDESGRELAFADDGPVGPDPVLSFDPPRDGTYVLEVADALFRGREDFVYRVTVEEEPPPAAGPPAGAGAGEPDPSVPLVLPFEVRGRIASGTQRDRLAFGGRAGETVVCEVVARAEGSPLDPLLRLLDPSGAVLAWNDDHADPSLGLVTHQADSWLSAVLPADGTYAVVVSDAQGHGGPDHGYRLRVGPPRPDVTLVATPSSVNVVAGRSAVVTVHVVRRDGFDGPVDLALVDAPPGYALSGGRVPAGLDAVRATLEAPRGARPGRLPLRLEGRIRVEGEERARPVRAADEVTQAFLPRHLVPAQEAWVTTLPSGRGGAAVSRETSGPLRLRPGSSAHVRFATTARAALLGGDLRFALFEPPPGVTLGAVSVTGSSVDLEVRLDEDPRHLGPVDNLLVEAWVEPKADATTRPVRRASLGVLPAVPLELVP